MRTFRFNKLVRDKIVASQKSEGSATDYKVLNKDEYLKELLKKLAEESKEIDPAAPPDELLGELADLQEVIDCILPAVGRTKTDLSESQKKKIAKFGSFKKRLYIKTVTIDENNPWIKHYEANPDRYPEIGKGQK
jgi:predicted house-cleaning noncanonical NTP pyrophosphatase (MazG superfamily)